MSSKSYEYESSFQFASLVQDTKSVKIVGYEELSKSFYLNSESNRNTVLTFLGEKFETIMKWFKENNELVETGRATLANYPTNSNNEQHNINLRCREIFTKFRKDCGINYLEGEIGEREIKIAPNALPILTEMITEMFTSYSDGAIDKSAVDNKQSEASALFAEGIAMIDDSQEWPGVWPAQGKRSQDGRFVLSDLLMKTCAYVNDDSVHQEIEHLPDCDAKTELLNMFDHMIVARNELQAATGGEPGMFKSQEASLDSIFLMMRIMYKVGLKNRGQFLSFLTKLRVLMSKVKGEEAMATVFETSASQQIKSFLENLDDMKGGDKRKHVYQHPMLGTFKRVADGLCSCIRIPYKGTILNGLGSQESTSIGFLCMLYEIDKATSKRSAERNSLTLLHNYLKGRKNTFEYAGNRTGNVFKLSFKGAIDPINLSVTQKLYDLLKIVSANAGATDKNLLGRVSVGYMSNTNTERVVVAKQKP